MGNTLILISENNVTATCRNGKSYGCTGRTKCSSFRGGNDL